MSTTDAIRRKLKRALIPRSLFGRSLLIVILPIILLQLVLTTIFYNRHWDVVTRWLARGVAGEIAMVVELLDDAETFEEQRYILDLARQHNNLSISFEPQGTLDEAVTRAGIDTEPRGHIDGKIIQGFEEQLDLPFAIDLRSQQPGRVVAYVQLDRGLLRVLAERHRVTSTTTGLLLIWMVGSSVILLAVAVYVLRRQVKPIRRLARAVEAFGKGHDVGDFRPGGASEIRQAARAFNLMRHRILRHLSQRTEMLAAVSHDLRTPLTRMTLELEMMNADAHPQLLDLRNDVGEMRELVEAYLSFARDETQEVVEPTALGPIFEQMRERADRSGRTLDIMLPRSISVPLRPIAFRRCISNLVDNACRYGSRILISCADLKDHVQILVEDDGPGIPPSQREKAFQPFIRLDMQERRSGGTGLGLTIARDIVLAHGGELRLDQSTMGGLQAAIRIPH